MSVHRPDGLHYNASYDEICEKMRASVDDGRSIVYGVEGGDSWPACRTRAAARVNLAKARKELSALALARLQIVLTNDQIARVSIPSIDDDEPVDFGW